MDYHPNCSADNVIFIDEFITEGHRPTFCNLSKLQNNTKVSFDRIINSHAILNIRKFEVPDNICKIHSLILRNTKYRVQTALDIFLYPYKNSSTSPIHSTGKSLGSSGYHWMYISALIMNTLEKQKKNITQY